LREAFIPDSFLIQHPTQSCANLTVQTPATMVG
jgi:hypothetical protein